MGFNFSLSCKLACITMLVGALLTASAVEFPLQFKTIKADEVMSFPGGYGAYGQLSFKKPEELKAEPKAVSKYPCYGTITSSGRRGNGLLFRVDESQGDGKGYDQIIVDLNGNGDLTDDPVGARLKDARVAGNMVYLGPMESTNVIAGNHPVFYAQLYIFVRPETRSQMVSNPGLFPGQVIFKSAWYLETTVDLNGTKQKVGIYDGDSNGQLGDLASPGNVGNGDQERWYFTPGDAFLVDRNNSDSFRRTILDSQASPFGSMLYFGPTPYKVALLKECTALSVKPWTEPLAEVVLQPQGEQVSAVQLAREVQGKWQLLKALAANGKIQIPPGNYRLSTCTLEAKNAKGEPIGLEGSLDTPRKPFTYSVGATNTLQCGGPLKVLTQASKRDAQNWDPSPSNAQTDSGSVLDINSQVQGQGGEIYSSFAKGERYGTLPAKPTFVITGADGTKLANGNLEYG